MCFELLVEVELNSVNCLPMILLPSKYFFDVAFVRIEGAEVIAREEIAEVADERFRVRQAGLENAKNLDDDRM